MLYVYYRYDVRVLNVYCTFAKRVLYVCCTSAVRMQCVRSRFAAVNVYVYRTCIRRVMCMCPTLVKRKRGVTNSPCLQEKMQCYAHFTQIVRCIIHLSFHYSQNNFTDNFGQKQPLFCPVDIAILGVSSSIVINVPTRYVLVAGTKQTFQIVVGTFELQT